MASTASVAVLGGGIGGLSVAHELAERGFRVTVYERQPAFGGKARSTSVPGSGVDGRHDLPAEHGFRFFPGFYKHLDDTMARTPSGSDGRSCLDNLVQASRILLVRAGRQDPLWVARFPRTLDDFRVALLAMFDHLDIPEHEIAFFVSRLLALATSCETRYLREYEHVSFWDFIEAERRSQNYRRYLGQGMTRSLVAMRAEDSSTRTVGRILLQLFYGILLPGRVFDRLLDGPTNDAWIDPWRRHLERLGVSLVTNAAVRSLDLAGRRLGGVTVERDGRTERLQADHYVAAVPVEVMRTLVTPEIARAAPTLARLGELRTEWMNGIQFYLADDRPLADGHALYLDSNWALTSISQRQFWHRHDFSRYGDGRVGGILSVAISNWEAPGNFNGAKASEAASREEIKDEVWAQLKAALNSPERVVLDDDNLLDWYLDAGIVLPNPGTVTNAEPLLINPVGSLALRPEASTGIDNLFLAADYVRTHTDLATMEAANEAARRATNAILDASASSAPRCELFEFDIPRPMRRAMLLDRVRLWLGLPNVFVARHH